MGGWRSRRLGLVKYQYPQSPGQVFNFATHHAHPSFHPDRSKMHSFVVALGLAIGCAVANPVQTPPASLPTQASGLYKRDPSFTTTYPVSTITQVSGELGATVSGCSVDTASGLACSCTSTPSGVVVGVFTQWDNVLNPGSAVSAHCNLVEKTCHSLSCSSDGLLLWNLDHRHIPGSDNHRSTFQSREPCCKSTVRLPMQRLELTAVFLVGRRIVWRRRCIRFD